MFYLTGYFFSLKFVGIVLIGIDFPKIVFAEEVFFGAVIFTSMIPSHVTTKSPITHFKYLPFSQVHVLELQI